MQRLTTYLVRLFSAETLALFGVALSLLYLVQCFRLIDAASVRGQGVGALLAQALLTMAPLSEAFFFVCCGVGLARGLRTLQQSRELHILHVTRQVPQLFQAIGLYALLMLGIALLFSHLLVPVSTRQSDLLRANVAADLVSRTLVPNRFAELGSGVTITVGGRRANGEITAFFADDKRSPNTRRTYIAASALITADELGFVLRLTDGTIQYRTMPDQFSEISFARYDIPLERLTGERDPGEVRGDNSSIALVARAIESGEWPQSTTNSLIGRSMRAARVAALCLLVAAMCAFPSGRRRDPVVPIEIPVLGIAFLERAVSNYLPTTDFIEISSGSAMIFIAGVALLAVRLELFRPLVAWRRG
jgi:lipopolysaccharide export system permease protein